MAKAVRLADIGKKLNVSTVTVSKALSGQKGVSEELRAKIIQLQMRWDIRKVSPEKIQMKAKASHWASLLRIVMCPRTSPSIGNFIRRSPGRRSPEPVCHAGSDQHRSGETERTSQGAP